MILSDKKISIIGFGNQGFAWAQNMRDSGLNVRIGLRTGSKLIRKAIDLKFDAINIKQAFSTSDIICIMIPDENQKELFEKYSADLDDGQTVVFAHGYNIHYKLISITKDINVILVAPKATGESVREYYLKDSGVPCLIAVEKDATGDAWQIAKVVAESLGCGRGGIYKSTFKEETEINLFTEQAFYLSVLPGAIYETYNILVDAGYSKEAAYFEAVSKIKIFGELLDKNGLYDSFEKVSSIARLGGILSKDRLVNDDFRKELGKILKEIQDGTFLKRLTEEKNSGFKVSQTHLSTLKESPIEYTWNRLKEKHKRNE